VTLIWRGRVRGGKIVLDKREDFARLLANLEGRRVELILEPRRLKRSLPTNSYYWAVVIEIMSEATGYGDPIETHEALKEAFPVSATLDEYIRLERVLSTSQFTSQEFQDYIERICRLAASVGIVIPRPGDVTTIAHEEMLDEWAEEEKGRLLEEPAS
jgi:hypothetical protein